MQPGIGRESVAFHHSVAPRSSTSGWLQVLLPALGCFAIAQFFAVSSASALDPATIGQFSPVMTWRYIAVHAALLPTGKVLWWPPFDSGDNPTLWDPPTNTNTAITHV